MLEESNQLFHPVLHRHASVVDNGPRGTPMGSRLSIMLYKLHALLRASRVQNHARLDRELSKAHSCLRRCASLSLVIANMQIREVSQHQKCGVSDVGLALCFSRRPISSQAAWDGGLRLISGLAWPGRRLEGEPVNLAILLKRLSRDDHTTD